jgi:hypothetical protein
MCSLKKSILSILCVSAGLALSQGNSHALDFTLDEAFNGAAPGSTGPWMYATFTDLGGGNVKLTLTANLNVASEFISDVTINVDHSLPLTVGTITGASVGTSITQSSNNEDINGGGNAGKGFDILIGFNTKNSDNRFDGTESVSIPFSGVGLTALSFDVLNRIKDGGHGETDGTLKIAAHVQGLAVGNSGAITAGTSVPDGGSALSLLGIGLAALSCFGCSNGRVSFSRF